MTMIAARPRAMVLLELFTANRAAKRLMCVSEGYASRHAEINALLDELEALGALRLE